MQRIPSAFPDSDREDAAAGTKAGGLVVAPKQMSSALAMVFASYGSESESDGEPEGELACWRAQNNFNFT